MEKFIVVTQPHFTMVFVIPYDADFAFRSLAYCHFHQFFFFFPITGPFRPLDVTRVEMLASS